MDMAFTLVFFVYGLAFFSMGLAMSFEAGRSPILVERRFLIPLAVFGVLHGIHEWVEMFLIRNGWFGNVDSILLGWLRIGLLFFSFSALVIFGLQLIYPERELLGKEKPKWIAGTLAYVLVILAFGISVWISHRDVIAHIDMAARYSLAIPGSMIAGIALYRESNRAIQQRLPDLKDPLRLAAWAFAIYSLSQVIVPAADIFPANLLNSEIFLKATGIPIQVIRAAMAILITFGVIKAAQIIEAERQRRFLSAQQARLDALRQLEDEMRERETMRQELLRHIVQAQEEERKRIARELHDETSQTLTAFSLHLATLQKIVGDHSQATQQMERLGYLSRHMAEGIYRLMRDLRPAQLDDLGLISALQSHVREIERQFGLAISVQMDGERRRLDPTVETALYRIAQEALTNIQRHANVQQAQIAIAFTPESVVIKISDDGCGFVLDQVLKRGWGLAGMRERAESIGGELFVHSSPDSGTRVEVMVPTPAV